MADQDPASLDRLNDFILPEPVGVFPLALVWKFLILFSAVWLFAWAWVLLATYFGNAYRRAAIAELSTIQTTGDLAQLNELLKRTAMAAYGRDEVASLYGQNWVNFLKARLRSSGSRLGGKPSKENIDVSVLPLLAEASTHPSGTIEEQQSNECFRFARVWIQQHHVEVAS